MNQQEQLGTPAPEPAAQNPAGSAPAIETASANQEARSLRFMGFKVTDITSVSAFGLSILALAYQGWIAFQGARIEFLPPEEIAFRCEPLKTTTVDGRTARVCADDSYLIISASALTYINRGHPDYGGVIMKESVTTQMAGREINLDWKYHSNITPSRTEQKVAVPFTVPGRQALGVETQFYPRYGQCTSQPCNARSNFFPYAEFAKFVNGNPGAIVTLRFSTTAGLSESQVITRSCDTQFTAKMAEALGADWRMRQQTVLTCVRAG